MNTIKKVIYFGSITKGELSSLMNETLEIINLYPFFEDSDKPVIDSVDQSDTPENLFNLRKSRMQENYDTLSKTFDRSFPAAESIYLKEYDSLRRKAFISLKQSLKAKLRIAKSNEYDDLHTLDTILMKYNKISSSARLNITSLISNLVDILNSDNISTICTTFNLKSYIDEMKDANDKFSDYSNKRSTKIKNLTPYTYELKKECINSYNDLLYAIDVLTFGNTSSNCLKLIPVLNGRIDEYSKSIKKRLDNNKNKDKNQPDDKPIIDSLENINTNSIKDEKKN